MKTFASFAWLALLALLSQTAVAQTLESLPVSQETVLFAAGNPEPWLYRPLGFQGGAAKMVAGDAELHVIASKPNAGGGINVGLTAIPPSALSDTCPCLELVFRAGTVPATPQNLQMALRTRNRTDPKIEKIVSTDSRPISEAQMRDGQSVLRFKLAAASGITADDQIAGVFVVGREPGDLTVTRIAFEQLRNVGLEVVTPASSSLTQLEIQGHTLEPSAKVIVTLTDAEGKTHDRPVQAASGRFNLTWPTPPLTAGGSNFLAARIDGGNNPMDSTVSTPLFGYPADSSYAWLHVKDKQIMTSPQSLGGERPFIPVGVGYCRDVIIPAQDEEVAAFCKSQHLNTIRLCFYTRFFNNKPDGPIDLDYHLKTFVDPVIQAAKRHGLYVILDDHGYFSGKVDEAKARQQQSVGLWDDSGVNEWAARWGCVAEHYKNEPNVLGYELCNEPHDIEPQTVRDWYGRGLAAIRKVDTRHIVLLGNCDWSHARAMEKTWGTVASTFDAPYNNVVYIFHDYPKDNDPWQVQRYITEFRDTHNVPVLCSEFGATWWGNDETTCREFQAGMLGLFAKENVGWMVWALCNTVNKPRTPHPLPDAIRKAQNLPMPPKSNFDSCAYSDLWAPIARIMGTEFPKPAEK